MHNSLALLLVMFGGLLLAARFLDEIAERIRLPGILLVLLLGLLTPQQIGFDPHHSLRLLSLERADQLAHLALIVVLFFSGLTTQWGDVRPVLAPSLRLATLGTLITALLVMVLAWPMPAIPGTEFDPTLVKALFVGAMVCSTDSSAVVSLLRPLAGRLPKRLLTLIECESALNDPMAVILCGLALALAAGVGADGPHLVIEVCRQFLLGILLGFLGASLASRLLARDSNAPADPHLAFSSLAALLLLVGLTQLLGGSSELAAYVAGLVLGNSALCERTVLEQAHGPFTKGAELVLFLCMGLVVQPEQVLVSIGWALALLVAMQLARWLMVQVVLLRGPYSRAERLFISVAGLRGAVPIAMAIQAAASPVPWGKAMPPLALGVVLLGLLLQGLALVPMARRLGLASPS